MRRRGLDRRLRDGLHAARPPHASEAERRAWHVVRAAHAERAPVERRRRPGLRLALAAAAAAALAAIALTPAGAKVGDWIGEVVDPGPEPARSTLGPLPTEGRLLVVGDRGVWVVQQDGRKRQLPGYRDATWSPGGLFVAATRGRELVALETDGDERWTLPAPRRVAAPRWSPDGFRIAYRSGRELWVTIADNSKRWLLARGVAATPPAWRPKQPVGQQVLAYARGKRIHVVRADPPHRPVFRAPPGPAPRRLVFRTPPGPAPRELWWTADGRRLIAVAEADPGFRAGAVRIYGPRGHLLRVVPLPEGLYASGSVLAPGGRRLALVASAPGARSSELLVMRTDRGRPPRRRLGGIGPLEGLTWSIDGRVLIAGLPQADQWLFLRMRGRGGLDSVERIGAQFRGGGPARTGAFPRPAGWCHAEPPERDAADFIPCSTGAVP